jgi:glycine cleavage system transcriptional repressor
MEQKFIMTAFGEDRPGIVADVTQLIYEHDCNLEDASMTRLSNEFAMIFLFSGRGEHLEEQLSRACRRLEREQAISAFFRPVEAYAGIAQNTSSLHTLHIEGIDHAGIVYHVSKYLAKHHANIDDLSSKLTFMPESGTKMYRIEMRIEIPAGTSMEDLEQGLTEVGDDLHVTIAF